MSTRRKWSGRPGHSGNFVGTEITVQNHQVTCSRLGHRREDIHSRGHPEGTGTSISTTATTLLCQEGEGVKTFR